MHALELKMPLFLRQGKNTVEPPIGDVTLVFTDVEVTQDHRLECKEKVAE